MSGTPDPGTVPPGAPGTSPAAVPAPVPSIEARVARLLTLGTRLAIGLLAVGSLLLVANGISPLAEDWPPLDVTAIPADIAALEPAGFLWLGLLATIATPLLRVGAATLGFAAAGERRMVAFGIAVLVVIALAVATGIAGA
jgi:uncharacterized membrane protein